jgi:hypothetical protein
MAESGNGRKAAVTVLLAVVQGLLLAGGAYWVGQTRANADLLQSHDTRIAILETHIVQIRLDVAEIKALLIARESSGR